MMNKLFMLNALSLATASATVTASIASGAALAAFPLLGPVTSISSVYIPPPGTSTSTGSSSSSSLNIGLIIGVSVAGFILLVGIFITMIYCIRKRAKVVE